MFEVVPYITCDVPEGLVVQVTVAELEVMFVAATFEIVTLPWLPVPPVLPGVPVPPVLVSLKV
jgi:hypothetical protein